MKKILVLAANFETGGVTAFIKQIYENIDKKDFSMDYLVADDLDNEFARIIRQNGDMVYVVDIPKLSNFPVLNYILRFKSVVKQIKRLIKSEKYDIAYIHANAYAYLPAVKKLNIPVRIMQVHEAVSDFNGNEEKSFLTRIIWNYRKKMYNKYATIKAGDSKKACIAKFGESVVNDDKMRVIHPPINLDKFNPQNYDKENAIQEFNIDTDSFNIIHVGRLSGVKNQPFMIDMLFEIIKIRKCNLYIVGEGDKEKLILKAKQLGVENFVHFLPGNTSPAIYTAMDCSLLPSFSEAFGMVAVESQLMGVPCFASTNVPEDVNVGMCSFIDLNEGAKKWAEEILAYDYVNCSVSKELVSQFDIKVILEKLEEIFLC